MKDYAIISSFLNMIGSLICFIYIIFWIKKNKFYNLSAYLFTVFSVFFWNFGYFFWQISTNSGMALFWCRFLMAGAIFIPPSFFHFTVTFLGLKQNDIHRKIIPYYYILSILFLFVNFTPFFVNRVEPNKFFEFWPMPGFLYHPFLAGFLICMIYCPILMLNNYKLKDKIIQNQIKYITVGTFISLFGGSTNYFLWYNIPIPPYGNLIAIMYVLTITYGLTEKLMSIDLATRKLFSSILVFITLNIPFFIISFFVKHSLFWTIFLSSISIFVTLLSHEKLKTIFEPAMLGTKFRYLDDIRQLGKKYMLETFHSTDDLMSSLLPNIKKVIKLENISVFLIKNEDVDFSFFKQLGKKDVSKEKISIDDPLVFLLLNTKNYVVKELTVGEKKEKIIDTMNRLKAEVAYPLFVNSKLVGILFLGNKENYSMFNGSDFQELTELVQTCEYKLAMTLYNEQQHVIINIARGMNEIHDFKKLAEYLARTMQRAMDLSYISVYFFNEKNKLFSCYAQNSLNKKNPEQKKLEENNYFIRFLMQRQSPIFSKDIFKLSEDSQLEDLKVVSDITSTLNAEMIIPIICGKPWGFIILGGKNSGEDFTMNDLTNCTILMSNLSSATQNIVLSDIAVRDELTQIHNRRYLSQMSLEEISKAISNKEMMVVFIIDIDHFKRINDTYKHSKGDFVLKKVCDILSKNIRQTDLLVRYGGEEMVVFKCFEKIEEAEEYANRLRLAIMQDTELLPLKITASIGYSSLFVNIDKNESEILEYDAVLIRQLLLHGADKGLYSAKSQGRNKVCFGGQINFSDVLGKGFIIKAMIINDDKKIALKQETSFIAAISDVKISESKNAEKEVDDWCPDIILIDARNIENWKNLAQQIVSRHATSIVGICFSNISEDLRNELKDMGINKIFVGEGEAPEIASWLRDTKEFILS
jgi:diguanylate cyclase (GGDEF)-like protein